MKDLIIPGKRVQKEAITFLICFLLGFVANVGAIIFYKTDLSEIFTSLFYVLIFTIVLYIFWSLLRGIKWLLFDSKKKRR